LHRGDEQRFRELYDRTFQRLWAFVLRRLPDEHAARDVVADTYLAVWRRIRDVPSETAAADAWVFGTARRVLANAFRGNRRSSRLFDRIRQRPLDLTLTDAEADGADERVGRALAALRPSEREILALAFWEDLDAAQIARVLGCSKNAAAVRLTRARRAWRAAYEAQTERERDSELPGGER